MRKILILPVAFVCLALPASAQTADELVAKNIEAHGGMQKIKAITSVRMTGKPDGFDALVVQENQRPNLFRRTLTIQGMTSVQAFDGSAGWQIQPFGGRKEPDYVGEDAMHQMLLDADFDGPLVDYQAKGNKVEYLGHDTVDGDDALRLKVTLKNGDIVYYYLDPDTFLEIRTDTQFFIRGSVQESTTELGSYKAVNGVMYPFSFSSGPKNDASARQAFTIQKLEVNVPLEKSGFEVPAALRQEAPKK